MTSTNARDLGMKILKGMARVVGRLLALFGGGCVVFGTIFAVSEGESGLLTIIVLGGVLPLVVGLALAHWGGERLKWPGRK